MTSPSPLVDPDPGSDPGPTPCGDPLVDHLARLLWDGQPVDATGHRLSRRTDAAALAREIALWLRTNGGRDAIAGGDRAHGGLDALSVHVLADDPTVRHLPAGATRMDDDGAGTHHAIAQTRCGIELWRWSYTRDGQGNTSFSERGRLYTSHLRGHVERSTVLCDACVAAGGTTP